jgi:hypothetical protein
LANKSVKCSSAIALADTYTPIPKPAERNDYVGCYAWLTPNKVEPLHVKEQLPAGDREHLMQLWEKTDRQINDQRYEDQESFKNAEKQMGKLMHSSELVRRIKKLNPDIIVEDSKGAPGCAGFYLVRNGAKEWTNASFRKGHIPEFSIISTDTADLPTKIQYGWRTVLVRLLKFNAISWIDLIDTFGDVHFSDARGKHWHLNVQGFRN